jgi:amino acid adenylation domain-containing protein
VNFNSTETVNATGPIHRIVEARTRLHPLAPAVADADTAIDYAELNARANRLARHLRAHGVVRGRRVGICMGRSVHMIEAIFAIFKAGGTYVPMDPAYPAQRLHSMSDDAGLVAVLADDTGMRALAPVVAVSERPPIAIDIECDAEEWAAQSDSDLAFDLSFEANDGSDVAYVIYTSGSTGTPKGVEVTHAAVLHLWRALDALLYAATPEPKQVVSPRRAAINASLSFDASVQGWSRLLSGDCVVLVSQPAKLDPDRMLALLEREAVDLFDCTPAQLSSLIDAGLLQRPALASMKVVVGGEAIPPALWRRIAASKGPFFFNGYGPTETTVYATATAIDDQGASPHIGWPLRGVRIEILDTDRLPVAKGEVGEIYIGGAGVARGYLGRPELTAERFIADPRRPDERLYRTGDLGRWRDDGAIEYHGRNDSQVKVRGFRIELGEIEAGIARLDGVRDAIVLARDDDGHGKKLVAYYRVDASGTTPAAIRAALAAHLPEHMLPAVYVRMAAWPQTMNGKLDRDALPLPDEGAFLAARYVAPQSEVEIALAALWAQLLGGRKIGRDDQFLLVGGDSLRAIQLASRIRVQLRRELPIHSLFRAQSLAEMAAAIDACPKISADGQSDESDEPFSSFDAWNEGERRQERAPLSYQQYGLWLLEQVSATSLAYNAQNVIRIRGRIEVDVFARALQALVQRHEILRTTFHVGEDGEPYQNIHSDSLDVFAYLEPQGDVDEARIAMFIEEHVQHRFNLSQLPLLRFTLIKIAPAEYVLIQVEHHYVHDGWSMNLILREALAIYDAFRRGEDSPLPPLSAQFQDYARWQHSDVARARFLRQAQYWKRKLQGAPLLLPLSTDFTRPAVNSYRGDQVRVELPLALASRLRAFCAAEGLTLYAAMQAAFSMLIAHRAGCVDFVIGSAVGNRAAQKSESLVGMFVNMIPVRCDLSGDPSYRELVERTIAVLAENYEHQEAPFEWVVREVRPARQAAVNPVFQVAFNSHNSLGPQLVWPEFEMSIPEVYGNRTSKFDFDIVVVPNGYREYESLMLLWNYSVDLYRRETIQQMSDNYLALLDTCVSDPRRRIGDYAPMLEKRATLDAEDYRRVVREWARTGECSPDRPVHGAFETYAAAKPEALALSCGEVELSYGELNARANRLARHLRARGVGPEVRVAICMQRSEFGIEAVLAAMKSGGAYVPMDPSYPCERLAEMLVDAQPLCVLTDAASRAAVDAAIAVSTLSLLVMDVDRDREQWSQTVSADINPLESGLTLDHLAYVIYTSGSTGKPKGVMMTHRGPATLREALRDPLGLSEATRVLQFASFSFDAFVLEWVMAFGHGGSLHLGAPDELLLGDALEALVARRQTTHCFLTPTLLSSLPETARLASIHTMTCGGEAVPSHVVRRWHAGRRFFNVYGPTETTAISIVCRYEPGLDDGGNVPIGRPLKGENVYILDRDLQPVSVGAIGEIHIGGAGVARGYLERAALTRERFIDNPFVPGDRLYKTGDMGRWREDSLIECLGRNDSQVKIRGFRIELGEIEARLAALPGVREAVVLAREHQPYDKQLTAYIVFDAEETAVVSLDALRDALDRQLPHYMVPSAYVRMTQWPLTENGKLNVKALPAPKIDEYRENEYVAPTTPIEAALANLWARALGLERIGMRDDFFRSGGYSVLGLRLILSINETFGTQLSLRDLFEHPTAERMLEAIYASVAEDETADV